MFVCGTVETVVPAASATSSWSSAAPPSARKPAANSASEPQNAPQKSSRCGSSRACTRSSSSAPGSSATLRVGELAIAMPIYPSLRAAVGRDRAAREGCKNSSSGLRHRGGPADEGLVAVPSRLARTRRDRVARAARWAISTAAALGAGGVLLFFSQPAAALVTKTEGGESVGITPREAHFHRDASVELKGLETGEGVIDEATASFTSNGAPVLHSANTY